MEQINILDENGLNETLKKLAGSDEKMSKDAEQMIMNFGNKLFELITENSIKEAKARCADQNEVIVEQCDVELVCSSLFSSTNKKEYPFNEKVVSKEYQKKLELLEKFKSSQENE